MSFNKNEWETMLINNQGHHTDFFDIYSILTATSDNLISYNQEDANDYSVRILVRSNYDTYAKFKNAIIEFMSKNDCVFTGSEKKVREILNGYYNELKFVDKAKTLAKQENGIKKEQNTPTIGTQINNYGVAGFVGNGTYENCQSEVKIITNAETRKNKWYKNVWFQWILGIATALFVAYIVWRLGWN